MELADPLNAESARPPLIGEGRIDEAIAENPLTSFQRRFDCLLDMIRPGGGKQKRFRFERPILLFQHHSANGFGAGASTRLPRFRDVQPARL